MITKNVFNSMMLMNLETFPSWLLAIYSLKVEVSCGEIMKQKSNVSQSNP